MTLGSDAPSKKLQILTVTRLSDYDEPTLRLALISQNSLEHEIEAIYDFLEASLIIIALYEGFFHGNREHARSRPCYDVVDFIREFAPLLLM